MMRIGSFIFGAFLLAEVSSANAMFINGGFETGDFTGWTVSDIGGGSSGVGVDGSAIPGESASFEPAFVNVRGGTQAAFAVVATSLGEFLSLSQTIDLAAGTYNTGFFMGNDNAAEFGINGAISNEHLGIFVDGNNIGFDVRFPDNSFPVGTLPTDTEEFSSEFSVLGGLHTIEFRISGSGNVRPGISVDDAFLNRVADNGISVPEPSTLAVFALGLLGLGMARRTRKTAW